MQKRFKSLNLIAVLFLLFLSIFTVSCYADGSEYIVQRGDSLWNIGKYQYKITAVKDLKAFVLWCLELNPKIKQEDLLFVGQTILLPENSENKQECSENKQENLQNKQVIFVEKDAVMKVIQQAQNKTPEEIDALLSTLENYDLIKNSTMLIGFGKYELKIKADRLLTQKNVNTENKNEYLINYLSSSSEKSSIHLKNLLNEKGIVLVEILVR